MEILAYFIFILCIIGIVHRLHGHYKANTTWDNHLNTRRHYHVKQP
jgi:hypothetical protein